MKQKHDILGWVAIVMAALVILAALPAAIIDTFEHGRVYLFSREFIDELPLRFSGPGRLRFILQPLVAIVLGCRSGLNDARAGQRPYLYRIATDSANRKELIHSGLSAVRNLLAMGIVLDAIAQLLIYRIVHPGAALVFGPVLICMPYAVSRALANRAAGLRRHRFHTHDSRRT
ncbi:hypothetical protein H3V53_39895 [Paraburkholderia bengalensis]|uniref:Uncharacterized protein n=1 Tax=Paraburkholderia bengalensis TaxID=2747562 RepID=A0ABU8J5S6_9BURK